MGYREGQLLDDSAVLHVPYDPGVFFIGAMEMKRGGSGRAGQGALPPFKNYVYVFCIFIHCRRLLLAMMIPIDNNSHFHRMSGLVF